VSENIGRDPAFREQYAGGVKDDPQVEAALAGSNTPSLSLPPATLPIGVPMQWGQAVKLR
jgi:hypothetical protein